MKIDGPRELVEVKGKDIDRHREQLEQIEQVVLKGKHIVAHRE